MKMISFAAVCAAATLLLTACSGGADSSTSEKSNETSATTVASTTETTTSTSESAATTTVAQALATSAQTTVPMQKEVLIASSLKTIPEMNVKLDGKKISVYRSDDNTLLQELEFQSDLSDDQTYLETEDFDFDGQDDLRVNLTAGTPNVQYAVWLYDTDTNEFVYNSAFSALVSPVPDAESHTIKSFQHVSATDSISEIYQYNEGNLVIVQRVTITAEGDQFRYVEYQIGESGDLVKQRDELLSAEEIQSMTA